MNAAEERPCQAGIVPAFARLMGTDRDKGKACGMKRLLVTAFHGQ